MPPDLQWPTYALTVLLNLALAVAIGVCLAMLWLSNATSRWAHAQRGKLFSLRWISVVIAISANALLLLFGSAAMAEVPLLESGDAVWLMLTATHWGMAWMIGIAALLLSILATTLPLPEGWSRGLVLFQLLALSVFLYTRSMVSHASADGDFSAAMLADWMHLVVISVWVGEVFVSGLFTLNSDPGTHGNDCEEAVKYIEALSTSATLSLIAIVATGSFSTWHNLGSLAAVSDSPYGNVLLVKLGLVVLAISMGGFNRFRIMPNLIRWLQDRDTRSAAALRQFRVVLQVEATVLFAVLIVAAVLSSTSPPTAA